MMNVRKQQFKNFEILAKEIFLSDCQVLLSILKAFTVGTEENYPK